MFEKLVNDVKNYDYKYDGLVNIADNIYLNDENFKRKLDNLENEDDQAAYKFISEAYKLIIYKIANRIDTGYIKGFLNERFLSILYQVVREDLPTLNLEYITYLNTLVYDYLAYNKSVKDKQIANQLLNISRLINQNVIVDLMTLGLTENLATYIALSYRSSLDESVTIPRVNFVLLHENPNFMDTQRIVCIYEKLYNRISNLFIHTLCDVVIIDETVEDFENKQIVYEHEADAVVAILNSMPSQMIHDVLTAFVEYCNYNHYLISNIRYSLRAMPVDEDNNERVLQMIDYIYNKEGKFIM